VKRNMVPKCKLFKNVPLHIRELNYEKNVCELEDHVGEEALNLNLPPKPSLAKNFFYKFSHSFIRKHLNRICVSLWLVAPPQGGKARHH